MYSIFFVVAECCGGNGAAKVNVETLPAFARHVVGKARKALADAAQQFAALANIIQR